MSNDPARRDFYDALNNAMRASRGEEIPTDGQGRVISPLGLYVAAPFEPTLPPRNINDLLRDLSKSDGRLIYDEGEPPYPIAVIESAVDMGLISHFMSGGMQSTDVTIKLTALGRQRVGLAPLLPWYRAAIDWVCRIYPLSTNRKCE